ncbi:DUF1146 domain-containing protein [Erysipelothrix sp. HDW6A]|uniref:DUF1146 family protein n=1 Tax=Erysipelothrix sp. HDW6A TaxID=2714928 RepID=UPI0014077BE6|nr:DUF1146 family protein [Erysipelothrix sp. HDW6A]QIK56487.1 DUF1146 domain-containing protein [Erysipelothrix sp. HDW6A]
MYDILRISVYLLCFLLASYALSGFDFSKVMRPQSQTKMQVLYLLLSLALAYLVAQFLLGLSVNYLV